jgi:ABC-type nitrate/sulfonate/bicarbonate transport system substrate-binding protein
MPFPMRVGRAGGALLAGALAATNSSDKTKIWEDAMFKWRTRIAVAAVGTAVGFCPSASSAQEMEIVMALPAPTMTFSSVFLAEDAGFFKKEGLKVSLRNLVGVAATNAVLAGSADFTMGTGPVFLRAAAQGQRMLALANLIDRPLVELVLRKDVAEAEKVTDKMSLAERGKLLKGKTIGIQGVGSIIHAWTRLVGHRGGLDVEKDFRIAPMNPPAMLPALESKQLDGYATSLPFTTQAVLKGSAVMFASGFDAAPDLLPFAYGLLYTRPQTCVEKRESCARMARAMAGAAAFIHDKPDAALALLRKRFAKMDAALLAAAWQTVSKAHPKDIKVTVPGLQNSQRVSLEAQLLADKDALKSFDGLYTDEFLR